MILKCLHEMYGYFMILKWTDLIFANIYGRNQNKQNQLKRYSFYYFKVFSQASELNNLVNKTCHFKFVVGSHLG